MGILSKLFGSTKSPNEPDKSLEYKGYLIVATPFKATGGWQLAGSVAKDGKTHKFIRADQFTSKDEAEQFAISKGQLIVDQMGEAMFKS